MNSTTITSGSGRYSVSPSHRSGAVNKFNRSTPNTRNLFTSSRYPTLTRFGSVVGNNSHVAVGLSTTSKGNCCRDGHASVRTLASLPRLINFPVRAAAALAVAVPTCKKAAVGMWTAGGALLQTKSVRCNVRNASSVVLTLSALHSMYCCAGVATASPPAPVLVSSASARVAAVGAAVQPVSLITLPSLRHSNGPCSTSRVPDVPVVKCPSGAAAVTGSTAAFGGWRYFSRAHLGAVSSKSGRRWSHSINSATVYNDSSTSWCCARPPAREESEKLKGRVLPRKETSPSYTSEKTASFGSQNSNVKVRPEQSGVPSARYEGGQRSTYALRDFPMPWLRDGRGFRGTRRRRPADAQPATAGATSFQRGEALPFPSSVPPAPVAGGNRWLRTPPAVGSVAAGPQKILVLGVAAREFSATATTNSAAVESTQRGGGKALRSTAVPDDAGAVVQCEAERSGEDTSTQRQAYSRSKRVHAIVGSTAVAPADGRTSESAPHAFEAADKGENKVTSGSSDRREVSGVGKGDCVGSASTLRQTSLYERAATHAATSFQHEQSQTELRELGGRDAAKEAKAVRGVREEPASPGTGTGFVRFESNSEGGVGAVERHLDADGSLDREPRTAAAAPAGEADAHGTLEKNHGRALGDTVAAFIKQNRQAVEGGDVKVLLLMRHAQSEFNLWRAESLFKPSGWRYDQGIKDVGLTDFGVQQCLRARQQLLSMALALPQDIAIDIHLASPLMRAVQTALTSFPCPQASLKKSRLPPAEADADLFPPPGSSPAEIAMRAEVVDRIRPAVWILTPLLRERLDTSGDVGSEKDQLLARVDDLVEKKVLPSGCCFISSSLNASLLPQGSTDAGDRCTSWCLEMPPEEVKRVRQQLPVLWTREWGTSERSKRAVTDTDSVQQQVLQALLKVHDFSEQSQRDRQTFWKVKAAGLWNSRFLRKVPLESTDSVFARMRLVLAAICQVRDARIVAMVGHSVSFVILTHASKMSNAQVLPFVLDCKAKTIAPLLLEEPGKVGRPASTRFPSEETVWEQLLQKLKQLNGV